MVFNIVSRNHDDHSKNFAFLLAGSEWSLAPAYDLVYSYKPGNKWINSHWMSLNGKRDDFTRRDFYSLEKLSPLFTRIKIDNMINETIDHVSTWRQLAEGQDISASFIDRVESNLRLFL